MGVTRDPAVEVRAGLDTKTLPTWLVAKGTTFARVGIGEGVEWRQPLDCAIAKKSP